MSKQKKERQRKKFYSAKEIKSMVLNEKKLPKITGSKPVSLAEWYGLPKIHWK